MPSQHKYRGVEDYLATIRQLMYGIPKVDRDEALKEMAQHLEALVSAEVDAGLSEPDATGNAIVKFGDPDRIARRYRREWLHEYRKKQLTLGGWVILTFLRYFFIALVTFGLHPNEPPDPWYRGFIDALVFGAIQGVLFSLIPRYPYFESRKETAPSWFPKGLLAIAPYYLLVPYTLLYFFYIDQLVGEGHVLFSAIYFPSAFVIAYLAARATNRLLKDLRKDTHSDTEPKNGQPT